MFNRARVILALGLAAALGTMPRAAQAAILSHWTFDTQTAGVTPDSVGSIDGTLMGNAHLVAGGVSGNAVALVNYLDPDYPGGLNTFPPTALTDFVAMGNHYEFAFNAVTGAPAFTLIAWIKPTTNGQVGHVAGSYESPGDGGGYVLSANFGAPGGSISAYTGSVGSQVNANNLSTEPDNTYDLYDGQWHQLTMVYTGTLTPQTSLWVDGKLAKAGSLNAVGPGGQIGPDDFREFVVGGEYFINRARNIGTYDGLIDDVQLYDTALTAQQIALLYENPGYNLVTVANLPEPSAAGLLGLAALASLRRRVRR